MTIRMHDGRTQTVKVILWIYPMTSRSSSLKWHTPILPLMAGEYDDPNELIAIGTPLGLDWTINRGVMSQIRPPLH